VLLLRFITCAEVTRREDHFWGFVLVRRSMGVLGPAGHACWHGRRAGLGHGWHVQTCFPGVVPRSRASAVIASQRLPTGSRGAS
jgi:hypothetical protein